VGLAVVFLSLLYLASFVDRGWIPHDEGMLGQSAERVLSGELPHRDFDEPYTGGLAGLHALAFLLLGVKLLSLRWVLLAFSVPFTVAVYAIAARLAGPFVAGLLTLLAVVWSLPNYFAGLPSWYNLFFATFGLWAFFKELESGRRIWLFLAGLSAGISLLFLIIGLYTIAAGLMFLAFREERISLIRGPGSAAAALSFRLFKSLACGAFLLALVGLCHAHLYPMGVIHFILPGLAATVVLLVDEFRDPHESARARFSTLRRLVVPYLLGVAVPVASCALFYLWRGAARDLARGLFVLSQRQVAVGSTFFPPVTTLWTVVPGACLLAFSHRLGRRVEQALFLVLAAAAVTLLATSGTPSIYDKVWNSARSLNVVAALLGCWRLISRAAPRDDLTRYKIFLLVSACALVGLVQFPFPAPIYFCYFAPLVLLALASISRAQIAEIGGSRKLAGLLVAFYFLFAVLRLNQAYVVRFLGLSLNTPLKLDRAGIRVRSEDARQYETLIAAIRAKPSNLRFYSGPDSPEVYFLSARPNLTRFFFDFREYDPAGLLHVLEEKQIDLVALNRAPHFSAVPSAAQSAALQRRYPHWVTIERFVLMWR
jgi:hypothetical protein